MLPLSILNRFALASLAPAVMLFCAALWGGLWAGAAIFLVTAIAFGLDKFVLPQKATIHVGGALTSVLGILHLPVLGLCVWSIGQAGAPLIDKVLIVIAAGLYFGQISNSNAHELIHRKDRFGRTLGIWSYASLLNGHHDSAHRLVHHRFAATDKDPNTAKLGEGFWRFFLRALRDEYLTGLRAESQLRKGKSKWTHPYLLQAAISTVSLGFALVLGGWAGLAGLLTIALYAQVQLCLSDYVQHYGLKRKALPDGSYEPIGPAHAWNAPHWYSSAMMLNAPRHSDHHMKPSKRFDELDLNTDTMPLLPHSLPVMAVIALMPPLWRNVMDKRVRKVRGKASLDAAKARASSQEVLVRLRGTGQRLGKLSEYRHVHPNNRNLPLTPRAATLRPDERF